MRAGQETERGGGGNMQKPIQLMPMMQRKMEGNAAELRQRKWKRRRAGQGPPRPSRPNGKKGIVRLPSQPEVVDPEAVDNAAGPLMVAAHD